MKKLGYALIALIFLSVVGIGIYFSVKNMGSKKEEEKPTEVTVNHKVNFNSNGGTEIETVNIKEGETVKKPEDPKKEGYIFANWYIGEEVYNFDKPIKEEISLEAKWISEAKKTFRVTFKYNNGSKDGIVVVEQNARVTKPSDITRKGYTFKGWYLNGSVYNFNNRVTRNIVVEARWDKNPEPKPNTVINPTEIRLDKTSITVTKESAALLTATVYPANATNKNITWSTSNSNIVTVNGGRVTGINNGEATITVRTSNGKTATCKVIVNNPLTGISIRKLSGADALYFGGPSIFLEASKIPGDTTTSGNVEWFSYDAQGQNGSISFIPNGNRVEVKPRTSGASSSATITAKLAGKEKSFTIPIENKLSIWSVSGDGTYNSVTGQITQTKYPAQITIIFSVPISRVTGLNNVTLKSGLNTSELKIESRAGGVSTPGQLTVTTKGGQTISIHIRAA